MATIPPIDIPGTLPENWELLVQMIQAMLPSTVDISSLAITETGELIDQLTGDKFIPIYAMREQLVGFAKVVGANPADTTNVAIRPITDIVPVAGGQIVKDIVSGKGSFGTVTKAVMLSSLLALFVSTLTPAASLHDYKEELLRVIEDYTIDGENVLVYIDEDGKSHVSETIMNAVRETLINMGVYESGGISPTNPINVPNYNIYELNDGESVTQSSYTYTPVAGHTAQIYYSVEFAQPYYPTQSRFVFYSKEPFTIVRNSTNIQATQKQIGEDVFYLLRSSTSTNTTSGVTPNDFYPDYYFETNLSALYPDILPSGVNGMDGIAYAALYYRGGGGVPGIGADGKSDFGDTTKTLEDIIPDLSQRYTTLATPTDDDPFHKDKWYELNLNDIDAFEDGLTSDQTDPEDNTQGDVDDATKDKIIDDLLNIIETITGTPDLPDIPAGDSGDTPPAEPPILNGSSNGLWAIYNPTLAEVHSFGAWLWSDSIIDQIVRQFNSPIDAIIGFHQIYCTPITGSPKTIKAGYLNSPVSAKEVTNQYVTINCGQINVNEYYHTALDYNYSKLALYLPFVGIVPLDTAVCVGSTLEVIYRIDVLTGTCLAQVKVIKENSNAVMYTFPGNCAVQIPLTATTYTGMVGVLINGASAVGSFLSGNFMSAVKHGAHALASGLNNLTGTQQSGSLGSNAGALGIRKPYLIITHPVSYEATAYNTQYGYPINKTVTLGSLSGYTKVKDIHLSGVPCTDDELELIERLLKEGVIIN